MKNFRAVTVSGFTMVELMIAMLLGLLVSGAAVVIVISALGQLRNSQDFSEIVDNGRVVLAMMGQDITHAGFMGELSGQPLVVGSNVTLQANNPITDCEGDGLNNTTLPQAGAAATFRLLWGETVTAAKPMSCIDNDARLNSDLIQIKRLIGREDTTATATTDAGGDRLKRVFMVTSAANSIIFNNTVAGAPAGVLPANPQYYEYQHQVYYIAETKRYGQTNFPILVRESLQTVGGNESMVRQELAEGVDDMRILYGIDDDGDAAVDRYVPADDVTDDEWDGANDSKIVAVQLALLMRAIDIDQAFRSAGAQSYSYAGKTQQISADGLRRKVLMRTFSLRNNQIPSGL